MIDIDELKSDVNFLNSSKNTFTAEDYENFRDAIKQGNEIPSVHTLHAERLH